MSSFRIAASMLLLGCLCAAPAPAQELRFGTGAGRPGDVVELEVWFEAGDVGVEGYDFSGEYDSDALQLVGAESAGAPASCLARSGENRLYIFAVQPIAGDEFENHLVCRIQVRIADDAPRGWHTFVIGDDTPRWNMSDGHGNPVAGTLTMGGVEVLGPDRGPGCRLKRGEPPSQDVPRSAPLCRCLQDDSHPLHRCRFLIDDRLMLLWELPEVPDPRDWKSIRWSLLPLRDDLPKVEVQLGSHSGGFDAKPVHFPEALPPLQTSTSNSLIKVESRKSLERMQVKISVEGETIEFEPRWPIPDPD